MSELWRWNQEYQDILPSEGFADRIRATMAKERKHRRRQRTLSVVGGTAAALVVAVNVSPTLVYAAKDIPLLGSLVEIVTFREYSYNDGHNIADVEVPELSGSQAADEINDQVQAYTDQLIAQFQADCEATGEGYQGLDITSSVVTDNDKWFTLRIDATKTQASGYEFSRFYHIDKATGETATLSDLFADDANYVEALSAEVLRQMEEQMAQDESKAYFTDQFTAIDPEQNFYWNTDGDLVLVFDEYSIAAGYMGMPEFVIPASVYEGLLK